MKKLMSIIVLLAVAGCLFAAAAKKKLGREEMTAEALADMIDKTAFTTSFDDGGRVVIVPSGLKEPEIILSVDSDKISLWTFFLAADDTTDEKGNAVANKWNRGMAFGQMSYVSEDEDLKSFDYEFSADWPVGISSETLNFMVSEFYAWMKAIEKDLKEENVYF